jgi:hypothetical protein
MKKRLSHLIVLAIVFILGTTYGIIILKYQIFPYEVIKTTYAQILKPEKPPKKYPHWSIGIYEGSTLFDMANPKDISNPIMRPQDVTDIHAAFVADPFVMNKDGKYFLFFEALNKDTNKGEIAYAESSDSTKWDYKKVVIDEKFHLSYPYVFEWKNSYYLIPESNQDFSVRLYKATKFPEKWEHIGNILSGYRYVDPSIFRYKDKWWLFVSTPENNVLNLYFSDDLLKGWQPHPKNPVVRLNRHFSRPGGRVFVYDNKLLRFTQDDDPEYGIQIFAFEITELTETSYAEKLATDKPIVSKSGIGWNAAGMHNFDPIKIGNKWRAVVDGR